MGQGYQDRDHEIIDYELWRLEPALRPLRGPRPPDLGAGRFFAAVGAAQTFGCYTPVPFAMLLQRRLGMPALNLGVAGAGPSFFTARPGFITWINRARFAIVQVMSGRSESNARYLSEGGEMLTRRADGQKVAAQRAWEEMLRELSRAELLGIVEETRENWLQSCRELLQSIEVPTILFWFSVRTPDYEAKTGDVLSLFGEFPQLVTARMVEALRPHCDAWVECVSSRGMPQALFSRFTGEPASITMRKDLGGRQKTHNDYYPSPEMHEDAAALLEPACRSLLES